MKQYSVHCEDVYELGNGLGWIAWPLRMPCICIYLSIKEGLPNLKASLSSLLPSRAIAVMALANKEVTRVEKPNPHAPRMSDRLTKIE